MDKEYISVLDLKNFINENEQVVIELNFFKEGEADEQPE